jgi:RNA methyltransferase, TrmH family
MVITSVHNPRVKAAARLRDRKGRDEQGRIIIDGVREIGRAIEAGLPMEEVYFFAGLCGDEEHQRVLTTAPGRGAELIEVAPHVMEKLAFGQRAEGIVAVARRPERKLEQLTLAGDSVVAVIEGAEKPGNVGAIVRTADAAGLSAVLVADGGTDLYNPNAIRASLGSIFSVPVCEVTSADALRWLREQRFGMFAARVDGAVEHVAADFRGRRTAIVLGSEARGLSEQWRGEDVTAIRLPMLGRVDSLNLSATAAVLFYEVLRQRQKVPSSKVHVQS